MQLKYCPKCGQEKPLDRFSPDKTRSDKKAGHCRDCNNKAKAKWRLENKEYNDEQGRKWHRDNPEHSHANSKKWRIANPERHAFLTRKWAKKHPEKRSHNEAKRRIYGKTIFGQAGILKFYKNKPVGMEVDHIIPLIHDDVQGLHVIWNLQYLPSIVNRQKHNKCNLIEASMWYGKLLEKAGLK